MRQRCCSEKRGSARSSLFRVMCDGRNRRATIDEGDRWHREAASGKRQARNERRQTRMAGGVGGAGSIPVPTRLGAFPVIPKYEGTNCEYK